MLRAIGQFGHYVKLMFRVFSKPEKHSVYLRQTIREIENHGLGSINIIVVISLFIGAALTIQSFYNIDYPGIPVRVIGVTVRDALLLEFSSTIVGLVIAGKCGSSMASELGMMKVTEQVDALEAMGLNSASFLILPKIIALVLFLPILCAISISFGLLGGYMFSLMGDLISPTDFIYGIQFRFFAPHLTYALIKSLFYGFIIASVAGFFGYHVGDSALHVGKASTKAVVASSILILLTNLVLTNLILY